MKRLDTKNLVYSTESGRVCPGCSNPIKKCCCKENSHSIGDGIVRVSRQTKGRKGSGVTLITGLPLGEGEMKKLAKGLKRQCGSGGTVKNGVIEIQGNHREALVEALVKMGYSAKPAGG